MKIGDEILIKVKVVDFDTNPHGSAVKLEVPAWISAEDRSKMAVEGKPVRFWIHRLDQPKVIVENE